MQSQLRLQGLSTKTTWGRQLDVKAYYLFIKLNPLRVFSHCRGEADKELDAAGLLRPSKPLPAWLHCPSQFIPNFILVFQSYLLSGWLHWGFWKQLWIFTKVSGLQIFAQTVFAWQKMNFRLLKTACVTLSTCLHVPSQNNRCQKMYNLITCCTYIVPGKKKATQLDAVLCLTFFNSSIWHSSGRRTLFAWRLPLCWASQGLSFSILYWTFAIIGVSNIAFPKKKYHLRWR